MKKFLKGILWLVVVLAVLAGLLVWRMDHVVLHGFNTVVPKVLGVDASLGSARIHALKGYASLKDLHVGNPEGFKTDGIFDLGEITVDVDMGSLGSDTIIIDCIKVVGAEVTYEQGLTGNNIGALLDQLAKEEELEKEEAEEEKEEGEEKPAKKVVIKKLDVEGTRLNVALTAMMGAAVPVPLPPIHMEGIGEESGGATPIEAVRAIIGGVFKAVQAAVAGAGDLLGGAAGLVGDGAKAVVQGAGAAVGAVADGAGAAVGTVADGASAAASAVASGASTAVGAVADGAAATVGAVADGAGAVGGAVVDGAGAVGGAVVGGVKSVGKLLNPFGGGDEKAEEE